MPPDGRPHHAPLIALQALPSALVGPPPPTQPPRQVRRRQPPRPAGAPQPSERDLLHAQRPPLNIPPTSAPSPRHLRAISAPSPASQVAVSHALRKLLQLSDVSDPRLLAPPVRSLSVATVAAQPHEYFSSIGLEPIAVRSAEVCRSRPLEPPRPPAARTFHGLPRGPSAAFCWPSTAFHWPSTAFHRPAVPVRRPSTCLPLTFDGLPSGVLVAAAAALRRLDLWSRLRVERHRRAARHIRPRHGAAYHGATAHHGASANAARARRARRQLHPGRSSRRGGRHGRRGGGGGAPRRRRRRLAPRTCHGERGAMAGWRPMGCVALRVHHVHLGARGLDRRARRPASRHARRPERARPPPARRRPRDRLCSRRASSPRATPFHSALPQLRSHIPLHSFLAQLLLQAPIHNAFHNSLPQPLPQPDRAPCRVHARRRGGAAPRPRGRPSPLRSSSHDEPGDCR